MSGVPTGGNAGGNAGAKWAGGKMANEVTPQTKHVLYGVRVIVEKQPLDNVWQPFRWVISDLLPLRPEAGGGAKGSGAVGQ